MSYGVKMTQQKDDLYEVIFDDGVKYSNCTLQQAVEAIEKHLYSDTEGITDANL